VRCNEDGQLWLCSLTVGALRGGGGVVVEKRQSIGDAVVKA